MKKLLLALAASVSLIAGFIVAAPASNAAEVTFVQGLLNGEFGAYQVFDVSRTPSFPSCTSTTPSELKVTVTKSSNNPQGLPFSSSAGATSSTGATVDLSNRYIKFYETGDTDYPWGIRLYQQTDDKELRWNSTTHSWITDATSGFADAQPFSNGGVLVAADQKGFLHISHESPWGDGYGTFISITLPRSPGDEITYTPDSAMNDCTGYKAGTLSKTGPVIKLDSTKTLYVPDHPLGPPTNDATLRAIKVNAGEVEGQVKADVFEYNWGVATTGTDSLVIQLFPTNSAATITYQGNLYRSGQPFSNIAVTPGRQTHLEFTVTSVDETVTQKYHVIVTAYPTNVAPKISKMDQTSASSEGGTKVKITGVGFTYAKGVVLTPGTESDVYSARAVTAKKVTLTNKHPQLLKGEFRVINDREIELLSPAAPNPAGGFYTGEYNVLIDTPFANSSVSDVAKLLLLQPQKPLTVLQWAKSLIVPGLTKLLGLPIKMNSGQKPAFKVFVKFFGRAKSTGDSALYTVIRKKDGIYIDMKTNKKAQVTTVVKAKGTSTYAPYYESKVLTSK